jgi:anti-sigma-K factor RskA
MSETRTTDPCEQQVNAAAWVLGALDEAETPAYAVHVDTCTHCQQEIAKLTMVRDALPLAVEQIAPPPELGDRIMGVVSSEAELLRAAGSEADRPAKRERERRGWRSNWLSGGVIGLATGAALAAGFVLGGIVTTSDSGRLHIDQAKVTIPGAKARLIVEGTRGKLQMAGMPNPPAGKVYEMWVLRSSATKPVPTSTLFSVQADGEGQVYVPYPLREGDKVLITAEQEGGADAPTSPPVISAEA